MNKYKSYGKGWHFESYRHSLAAKGVETNIYGDLLNSLNRAFPQKNESFAELGRINPRKTKISGMSDDDLKKASENPSLSDEQKTAIFAELDRRSSIRITEAQPRKETEVYDIQEDVQRQVDRYKKEQKLVAMKQDYAKRLSELKEFQQRKPTFEKEEIPDRLKLDTLQKLQEDIMKLDAEINPSIVKYERIAKLASEKIVPEEFEKKEVPYKEEPVGRARVVPYGMGSLGKRVKSGVGTIAGKAKFGVGVATGKAKGLFKREYEPEPMKAEFQEI
jgi:hypothetical protein